jgi:tetratricopeptide (TPR) repeat protein
MKKESLLIISCFIFSLLGITTHAQKVSNITFRQEQSTIIVSYDLETKTPCKISLFVSTNDGTTWQGPLKKVTGDAGAKIASGNHSITWNVLEEFEELRGDKIKFQVRADEVKSQTITSINQAIIKNPKDAKLFKLRGDLKKEANDSKGAIADYTKAILLNPKYADAYKARGFQRYIDDEAEAALSDINKAISLNPNDALTFYYRADLKNSLKDYNGAIFDYTKALELEPKNTQFLIKRANLKFELKDFVGSIDDCNKVIEFDSTSKWDRNYFERRILKSIYWFRGINKYNLNDIEGANSDFEKHFKLKLIPKHIGYIEIGSWRFNNNDYKSAIDHFTKSIDLLPETLVDSLEEREAYLGRAFSKYMQKNEIGAAVDFNKYIEKSQNKAEANYHIAKGFIGFSNCTYLKIKIIEDYNKAIYFITKAIELEPKDIYYGLRAEAKKALKEYRGAIDDYTKANELDPKHDYYFERANVKMELEDYRGAIEDYTKSISFDTNYIWAFYYRANAKFEIEDYKGAIFDYSKAIELFPGHSFFYNNRGSCKFNINNYLGAIADYTKAIQLDPKDANSYLNRGRLKLLTKDKKGGCKDLSKAGELGEDEAYKDINESCN